MTHGLDTGFLVAAEVMEHAEHAAARNTLVRLLTAGGLIAIAPQVLAELIHIATDPRRFAQPLDILAARQFAEQWWTAREVVHVFPDDAATRQFLAWLQQFSLGRKRLLDTLLAATYRQAGVQSLLQSCRLRCIWHLQLHHAEAENNDTLIFLLGTPSARHPVNTPAASHVNPRWPFRLP
jgi:predicted nucleic acid-binding protein